MNILTQPGGSRREALTLVALIAVFLVVCFVPFDAPRFQDALQSGFSLLQWYAREHVILCLLPAFLIAGAIYLTINFLVTRAIMLVEYWLNPHQRDAAGNRREVIIRQALRPTLSLSDALTLTVRAGVEDQAAGGTPIRLPLCCSLDACVSSNSTTS